jgi:5-formyltetrahydrofolate cyclo-ligase
MPYLHTKEAMRTYCLKRLRTVAKRPDRYGRDKRIQRKIRNIVEINAVRTVMAYVPLPVEANISPLLRDWRRRGITVYVPFMEGESFELVKYRYPLKRKRFGVCEPKKAVIRKIPYIDIAIIPVIATDRELRRIGFGKGMYDRFFQRYRRRIGTTVFVSRETCYTPYKITNDYDVKADIYVTGG